MCIKQSEKNIVHFKEENEDSWVFTNTDTLRIIALRIRILKENNRATKEDSNRENV